MSKAAKYWKFYRFNVLVPIASGVEPTWLPHKAGREKGELNEMVGVKELSHIGTGQMPLPIFIRDKQKPRKISDFQIGK